MQTAIAKISGAILERSEKMSGESAVCSHPPDEPSDYKTIPLTSTSSTFRVRVRSTPCHPRILHHLPSLAPFRRSTLFSSPHTIASVQL